VVLTPRRWRQVGRKCPAGDGDNKARSPGRARRKPLKPLRAGMPGESGEPVVTTLVWFYCFPREAAGASSTRHSPRPLIFRRVYTMQNSRGFCGEIAEACVTGWLFEFEVEVALFLIPPTCGVETSEAHSGVVRSAAWGNSRITKQPHPSHRSRRSRCARPPHKKGRDKKEGASLTRAEHARPQHEDHRPSMWPEPHYKERGTARVLDPPRLTYSVLRDCPRAWALAKAGSKGEKPKGTRTRQRRTS